MIKLSGGVLQLKLLLRVMMRPIFAVTVLDDPEPIGSRLLVINRVSCMSVTASEVRDERRCTDESRNGLM